LIAAEAESVNAKTKDNFSTLKPNAREQNSRADLSGIAAMAAGMIPTPDADEYLNNIRTNLVRKRA
jgi:hypothetical protein